ncbi:MAG TPA: hypothetical protein DHV14_12805 [Micrococcales bacterium]|nr:hypothetical protein [Micrococcales bacterium]
MPVVPVGVAADGQTEVPPDALVAGWYRFGPGVGATEGSVVVVAHAGSRITPRGPFYDLRDVELGAIVELTAADGTEARYAVVDREVLTKTTIDWSVYFERTGAPRLVLVTCGGTWDQETQSYRENVVVTAVPAA